MVSLATLPYFYALSENYGDPDDYLLEYEAGRLTAEAKAIYETLLAKGALDSLALRREAHLLGKESNTRFERGLLDLQRTLRILPVGVAQAGRWNYAFIYELLDRWLPGAIIEVRHAGLIRSRPRRIFELGCGVGLRRRDAMHFGHECVGTDDGNPMFMAMSEGCGAVQPA